MTPASCWASCAGSTCPEPGVKPRPSHRIPDVPAAVLAECINVLATHADSLPEDQFESIADRILAWADRFDRAPGREQVPALTLALLQFNRGMALLRLGRVEAAREALRLRVRSIPSSPGSTRPRT